MLKNKIIILIIVVLSISGCATTNAPSGWLESPADVNTNAWGGWLELSVLPDKVKSFIEFEENFSFKDLNVGGGEFICFQDSLVYVFFKNKVIKIPFNRIYKVDLEIASNKKWILTLWTSLGYLSTISHGIGAILTSWVWLIGGSVATVSESHRNCYTEYSPGYNWWMVAKKFSRYPQGLPADFDLSQIKPKPVSE